MIKTTWRFVCPADLSLYMLFSMNKSVIGNKNFSNISITSTIIVFYEKGPGVFISKLNIDNGAITSTKLNISKMMLIIQRA